MFRPKEDHSTSMSGSDRQVWSYLKGLKLLSHTRISTQSHICKIGLWFKEHQICEIIIYSSYPSITMEPSIYFSIMKWHAVQSSEEKVHKENSLSVNTNWFNRAAPPSSCCTFQCLLVMQLQSGQSIRFGWMHETSQIKELFFPSWEPKAFFFFLNLSL